MGSATQNLLEVALDAVALHVEFEAADSTLTLIVGTANLSHDTDSVGVPHEDLRQLKRPLAERDDARGYVEHGVAGARFGVQEQAAVVLPQQLAPGAVLPGKNREVDFRLCAFILGVDLAFGASRVGARGFTSASSNSRSWLTRMPMPE